MIKLRVSELRRIIRQVLLEASTGGAIGVDPTELDTDAEGFYPYELERGVDIQGKWYRSPGESEGDPGRPADPLLYIGMSKKEPETKEE